MRAIPLKIHLEKARHDTPLWYRGQILLGQSSPASKKTNSRRRFNPESLKELAESFKTQGILQRLVIRAKSGDENKYEVVDGAPRPPVAILKQRQLVIAQDYPCISRSRVDQLRLQTMTLVSIHLDGRSSGVQDEKGSDSIGGRSSAFVSRSGRAKQTACERKARCKGSSQPSAGF
jgi:hypothetical protein